MTEKGIRWLWVGSLGALGYLLPVLAFLIPIDSSFAIPSGLWRTLVPIANVTMLAPVDPDWTVVLGLFGPSNAIFYGLIGLVIAQKLIERAPPID
jgi:hypothetical protein